jgi:CRISPR system Cascade subunit CasC
MKYLNLHILQTVPYSNMNRDDAGSPKQLQFGGTTRGRLSSQALKRAARVAFEADSPGDRTSRSLLIPARITETAIGLLEASGVEVDAPTLAKVQRDANRIAAQLVNALAKPKDWLKYGETIDTAMAAGDDARSVETLVWLAEKEINDAATNIVEAVAGDVEIDREFLSKQTSSATIAAFGRMFAARPDIQTEAAIQVAHAFSTHAVAVELDYFTAVDDERFEIEGDRGAGHLNLAEFVSGVYYRYLNIDRDQLAHNWKDMTDPDASNRLAHLYQALILSLPQGKTNSTAPHVLPLMVLASESTQPASFAPAFENAIGDTVKGHARPSIEALLAYADRARATFGSLFGDQRVVTLDVAGEGVSFDELVDFCVDWTFGDES